MKNTEVSRMTVTSLMYLLTTALANRNCTLPAWRHSTATVGFGNDSQVQIEIRDGAKIFHVTIREEYTGAGNAQKGAV